MRTLLINQNKKEEVYFHLNAKGTVYFNIKNDSGSNKLYFWWTLGPFGKTKRLGYLENKGTIKIEGIIWGRLKVANADSRTILQIHDDPNVAMNFPAIKF